MQRWEERHVVPRTIDGANRALVRLLSPDEREYAVRLVAIEARRRQVTALQAELEPLLRALDQFESRYRAQVGTLTTELRQVRATIDELETRAARAHARLAADPDGLLGDDDELFDWDPPGTSGNGGPSHHRAVPPSPRPELDADAAAELRRLYRTLAKRCHPDLARSDTDRRRRQTLMLRVNAAYRDRDLPALRALGHEADLETAHLPIRSITERLTWALAEMTRLDGLIDDLADRLQTLRDSDTYPLWTQPDLGDAVIAQRAAHLHTELTRERTRLEELIEAYAGLVPA